ncbi:PREDICTED: uncharacterized protein LOC104585902 isoform X2 [Nelumbo nucifera]|uniref:Uncharacterized protein LOC104585902 isoform X2 n=2 Tax=Nelumbo nucifera TaxID=4432 RepID=A0A1U7Z3G0_NELNU|nr:PREDICTED: uncharacterized protein LOC104585902 isoform X2 [Nelumbo nucifera]DAD29719.1 TPA_asm: hypothetical protein HUJ06_031187 [Nelumbo nucifera]
MVLSLVSRQWKSIPAALFFGTRPFRSQAALDALSRASEEKIPNLVLYNYPSFSGAFSALFAHLYHSRLNLPCLILPFSSVEPLRVDDFLVEGLEICYLLDFVGPKGFALKLSQFMNRVIVFDHRKSSLPKIPPAEDSPENLTFNIDVEKSSSTSVYNYFSTKLAEKKLPCGEVKNLVNHEIRDRLEMVLKYMEDGDLRSWSLLDIKAFNIGLDEWRSKLNCITNPYLFDQLLEIDSMSLIAKGKSYISSRQDAANKLLDKTFKVRLGKGFYGECLGVSADGNADLSDEIGKALSIRSAAAGLRISAQMKKEAVLILKKTL